jgi:translation initiation factor IF-2
VGPISEADLSHAQTTGALILAFDVPCSPMMEKKAEAQGVTVRLHKLIYSFIEDVQDIVHDVKLKDLLSRGEATGIKVLG